MPPLWDDIPIHSFLRRVRTLWDQITVYMTHILPDPFPATTSPVSICHRSHLQHISWMVSLHACAYLPHHGPSEGASPACGTGCRAQPQTMVPNLCPPRPPCHLVSSSTHPVSHLLNPSSVPDAILSLRSSVLVIRGQVLLQVTITLKISVT